MKSPGFIYFILMVTLILSVSSAASENPVQTLYMIEKSYLTADTNPYFIGDNYALVIRDDIPSGVAYTAILPDQPGDYYVMLVKSPDDLKPLEDSVPYAVIGNDAIFRTDSEGAKLLPLYGWGLTRITVPIRFGEIIPDPRPPLITEYDPDIADMISSITPSTCEALLLEISGFPTRYSYSAYCRDVEQYAYDHFSALGLNVSYFDFSLGGTDMRNVIGELVGTTWPDSIIIICAHLDCTSEDPYNDSPGAEDNGTGSVVVMEAARILSQYQTDLTIRFISFTGEEQGLVGSDYYAQHMLDIGENLAAVINLDMVAYTGPFPRDMHFFSDPQSHWLGEIAAEAMGTYTSSDTITHYQGTPRYGSDHYSFAIRGYPAIQLIDAYPHVGEDWHPYYHTSNDVIDHLDMNLMAEVAQTGTATAAILARVDFGTQDIPTLSEWGMLIMGLLLLGVGTVAAVRRKRISLS